MKTITSPVRTGSRPVQGGKSVRRPAKSAYKAVAELRRRLEVRAREWGVGKLVGFRDLGTESFLVDLPLPRHKVASIRAVSPFKVRFNYAGVTDEVDPHDCESIIDAMDVGFETVANDVQGA